MNERKREIALNLSRWARSTDRKDVQQAVLAVEEYCQTNSEKVINESYGWLHGGVRQLLINKLTYKKDLFRIIDLFAKQDMQCEFIVYVLLRNDLSDKQSAKLIRHLDRAGRNCATNAARYLLRERRTLMRLCQLTAMIRRYAKRQEDYHQLFVWDALYRSPLTDYGVRYLEENPPMDKAELAHALVLGTDFQRAKYFKSKLSPIAEPE